MSPTVCRSPGEVLPSPTREQSQVETVLQTRTLASSLLALQHNWKIRKGTVHYLNAAVFLKKVGTLISPTEPPKLHNTGLPDNSVTTDNELGFGVPLVVCDVVMSLQPNPLLTFGQEAIVARFPLSKLHYWKKHKWKKIFQHVNRV